MSENSDKDSVCASVSAQTVTCPLLFATPTNAKLFIGNLPLYTKEDDIKKHIMEHVDDMEDFIVSATTRTSIKFGKPSCYGSVIVSCPAEALIPKINRSTMKGCKIKVSLFDSSRKRNDSLETEPKSAPPNSLTGIQHSYSQAYLPDNQEVCVIAMTTPPLTEKVPDEVLQNHFDNTDENFVKSFECFKCHQRPYFKLRLKFSSLDQAETAIFRMNGSMLLGKHKLKLMLERSSSRRHSLPVAAGCDNKAMHHRSNISSLSQALKVIQPAETFDCNNSMLDSGSTHDSSMSLKPIQRSFSVKVTNIKPNISKKVLSAHFYKAGRVIDCTIYGQEKYGIVTFKHNKQAEKAVLSLNGSILKCESVECILAVSLINPKPETDDLSENVSIPVIVPSSSKPIKLMDSMSTEQRTAEYCSVPSVVGECGSDKYVDYHRQGEGNNTVKVKSTAVVRSKKPPKPCISKPTKVIFHSSCMITSKAIFQEYMQHHIQSLQKTSGPALEYDVVDLHVHETSVEIEVLFSSHNQAKQVLKYIVQHDPNLVGHIACKHNPSSSGLEQKKAINDFRKSIATKLEYYTSKYCTKMAELQEKLEVLNAKHPKKGNIQLDEFLKLEPEIKAINQRITECENQYDEFKNFCDELLQKLEVFEAEACNTSIETIGKSRKHFGRECNRYQSALPMYAYRNYITRTILQSNVTILVGETGSGKSTQLVQYLYEAGLAETGIIVCTQPRKVAAISLAKHVSSEMGVTLGHELGYKTGLRGKYSEKTKVVYMTDHTLLNECIAESTFSKYSCLIIDEAHERSLSTDLLLAFIKQCLPQRHDLKVVITSATINPDLFVRYFGGNCPVIKVPGRTYPVDVIYCNEADSSPLERDYVKASVEQACELHENEPIGDFIVFLTSANEIEKACQLASKKLGDSAVILPLHGKLQPEDQQKVFKEYEKRKIVFSTNVAETSVTISGVKCIIDTGLSKELCFDPKKNINSLEVQLISKSSAEQRKGRAGRTSAGKCYRLYSEDVYAKMSDKSLPEILRVTLASTVLKLYEFGVTDVVSFNFVEEPDRATLEGAVESLKFLGAIEDGHLTDLGR